LCIFCIQSMSARKSQCFVPAKASLLKHYSGCSSVEGKRKRKKNAKLKWLTIHLVGCSKTFETVEPAEVAPNHETPQITVHDDEETATSSDDCKSDESVDRKESISDDGSMDLDNIGALTLRPLDSLRSKEKRQRSQSGPVPDIKIKRKVKRSPLTAAHAPEGTEGRSIRIHVNPHEFKVADLTDYIRREFQIPATSKILLTFHNESLSIETESIAHYGIQNHSSLLLCVSEAPPPSKRTKPDAERLMALEIECAKNTLSDAFDFQKCPRCSLLIHRPKTKAAKKGHCFSRCPLPLCQTKFCWICSGRWHSEGEKMDFCGNVQCESTKRHETESENVRLRQNNKVLMERIATLSDEVNRITTETKREHSEQQRQRLESLQREHESLRAEHDETVRIQNLQKAQMADREDSNQSLIQNLKEQLERFKTLKECISQEMDSFKAQFEEHLATGQEVQRLKEENARLRLQERPRNTRTTTDFVLLGGAVIVGAALMMAFGRKPIRMGV